MTAPTDTTQHIYVTFDGDTHWLACFGADPDAEFGDPIHPIDAGDTWQELATKVNNHVAACHYHR